MQLFRIISEFIWKQTILKDIPVREFILSCESNLFLGVLVKLNECLDNFSKLSHTSSEQKWLLS